MTERFISVFASSIEIPTGTEQLGIIQIDLWTILISLLNLLILFLLVKKFLYKPVRKIFDQRKAEVEKVYKEASDARDAAQADREYYEARKEAAESEAEELVRSATAEAKKAGEEIVREAKTEAGAIKAKAERDIEQEKIKAVNDAKGEIADISFAIAERIVGREIGEDDRKRYVDELVDGLHGDS